MTLSLLGASLCQAKLDGDRSSVLADQNAWNASSNQTLVGNVSIYTQTLDNGVTVRQYADASGLVFAVGWNGPVQPDYSRLLGAHYTSFSDAQRLQKRGVNLQSASLVIESGGMMRAFSGRAYLPARLPAGFSVQDVR